MSGDLKTWCVDANNSEGVTNMGDVQGVTVVSVESMIADLERKREEVYRVLREERSRLTARIAEIDATMAKVGASAVPGPGRRYAAVGSRDRVPYGTSPAAVLAYLKKHHNSRAIEISRGAGVPESSVYALLRRLPVVKVGRRMEARYSLATPEAAE